MDRKDTQAGADKDRPLVNGTGRRNDTKSSSGYAKEDRSEPLEENDPQRASNIPNRSSKNFVYRILNRILGHFPPPSTRASSTCCPTA
jgi:hypothetical protein